MCSETTGAALTTKCRAQDKIKIVPASLPLISVPLEQLAHLMITSLVHHGEEHSCFEDDVNDDDPLVPSKLTSVMLDQLTNMENFLLLLGFLQ